MDNLKNFKQVMALLAATYDKALTNELVAVYWAKLGSYRPEYLAKAADLHIADPVEGKYMARPAHLIAHINRMSERDAKSKALTMYIENQKLKHNEKKIDNQAAIGILKGLRA